MVRNIRVQNLIEIAKKDPYKNNQARIAVDLGISVATWNRWVWAYNHNQSNFTRSRNTINQVDRFIALHK